MQDVPINHVGNATVSLFNFPHKKYLKPQTTASVSPTRGMHISRVTRSGHAGGVIPHSPDFKLWSPHMKVKVILTFSRSSTQCFRSDDITLYEPDYFMTSWLRLFNIKIRIKGSSKGFPFPAQGLL